MTVIDAHLHVWDPAALDYDWLTGALDARFAERELAAAIDGLDGERSFVFVQAGAADEQNVAEIDWVAGLDLPIVGAVAHANVERGATVADALGELRQRPLVRGIRRLIQGAPDGFAETPAFIDGVRAVAAAGLVFDVCITARQLPEVTRLIDAVLETHPDARFVLDHLGKPAVGTAAAPLLPSDTDWEHDIRELATRVNVVCKISGLPGESPSGWDAAQLTPFLDVALDAFGGKRLVYASDWPASFGQAGYDADGYATWERFVMRWAGEHGVDEAALFGGNATRVYAL